MDYIMPALPVHPQLLGGLCVCECVCVKWHHCWGKRGMEMKQLDFVMAIDTSLLNH